MEFVQARLSLCEEEEEEEINNIGSKGSIISHGHHHHHLMNQQRWRSSSSTTHHHHHHHHQFYDKNQSSSSCDQPSLTITNSNNTTTITSTRAESSEGDGGSGGGGGGAIEREHMFDKVVTPSDVGKLNRLVIPKQHAEKYFPLDSSTNEKGLLLNFEDRGGKPWRFRYSYWNSSQSYVMTKGWSRFVKEKKLYAGDIVSFERGAGESEKDRLYIDWRRRPDRVAMLPPPLPLPSFPHTVPLGRLFLPSLVPMAAMARDQPYLYRNFDYYDNNHHHHGHLQQQQQMTSTGYDNYNLVNQGLGDASVLYLRSLRSSSSSSSTSQQAAEEAVVPMVFDSVPVVHGKAAAAKRLRLFGVNVECPISEDEVLSSTTVVPHTHHTTMPVSSLSHHHHFQHHQIGSSIPQYHHPLQLRLYNNVGAPQAAATTVQPSHELPPNREAPMSLDLDI
ncbi:hypothetical protein Sjap_005788 [Stephania japonica]|uniref:TF-B3 domain-containing protein n=1 Tax=Stephania japonica TaxID=461633 RepID=A0AAP0PLG2_9MAGN